MSENIPEEDHSWMMRKIIEDDVLTRSERGRKNRNPYISGMKEDRLYHIGLVSGPQDMAEMFGDVKVGYL